MENGPLENTMRGLCIGSYSETHGATKYTCATCGVWYEITAGPTGHTEQTQAADHGATAHSCTACDALWYTPDDTEKNNG